MRHFSFRPALTTRGRKFKGLRGWAGKPLHPPLTDFPIAAYVLAAVFDVISAVAGKDHTWARELWHAVMVLENLAVRLTAGDGWDATAGGIAVLSVIAAVIVMVGATYGGTLVFDYGFNVETAGDHPVWHKSETDVFPGATK